MPRLRGCQSWRFAVGRWLQEWEMYENKTTDIFLKASYTPRQCDDVCVVKLDVLPYFETDTREETIISEEIPNANNETTHNYIINNEIINNEITHNYIINNEIIYNFIINGEIIDNEIIDNENANNEIIDNEIIDNENANNENANNENVNNETTNIFQI